METQVSATAFGPSRAADERDEEVFRRIVVDVVGAADIELADLLFAEDYVALRTGLQTSFSLLGGPGPGAGGTAVPGKQAFLGGLARIKASFPDWACHLERSVAAGGVVAGSFVVTGSFTGDASFFGAEPNGARFEFVEAGFLRFREGRAVEGWFVGDELALMHAIGRVDLEL